LKLLDYTLIILIPSRFPTQWIPGLKIISSDTSLNRQWLFNFEKVNSFVQAASQQKVLKQEH